MTDVVIAAGGTSLMTPVGLVSGEVLTYLRETYPALRVYSFDYHLDLSALSTLIRLRRLHGELPAMVINNRAPVYGFNNLDEMQALIPELKTLATSSPQ